MVDQRYTSLDEEDLFPAMTEEEQEVMMKRKLAQIAEEERIAEEDRKVRRKVNGRLQMHGQKNIVMDIMSFKLPPDERKQFRRLAGNISTTDFFKLLPTFFEDGEIRAGLLEYVSGNLQNITDETGVKIDAVLEIYGTKFNYGCYNEEMGI